MSNEADFGDAAVGCLALLALPIFWACNIAADSVVFRLLWGWFIVPTFHLPPLTIAAAAGVSLVVAFAVPSPDRDTGDKGAWGILFMGLWRCLGKAAVFLAIGWALHHWWPL